MNGGKHLPQFAHLRAVIGQPAFVDGARAFQYAPYPGLEIDQDGVHVGVDDPFHNGRLVHRQEYYAKSASSTMR